MAQTENQKKLLKILQEIFQLDQSDLDFGIYRIMNTKSQEINEFLDNDLLSSVSNAFSSNGNSSIQKELDEAIQQAQSLGVDAETIPKVQELKNKLATTTTSSNLENDVFSHLANFFKRYYKDGDFVSLRRYKKDTYAIPYEGEEVKLHWANSDQYYIKSGEYFRDYTFTVNDKKIHLKLSDAQTQSNNNKGKERQFVFVETKEATENSKEIKSFEIINNELFIYFEYKTIEKDKTKDLFIKKKIKTKDVDKVNTELFRKLFLFIENTDFKSALNNLAPTPSDENRTIFEKHLKSYTSKNSFDYFIHKDLGGFLGRELDFYIKNEMLFLDDIMLSTTKYGEVRNKINIFKEVSQKIIDFLTQLEELQKKLWEKKKFIIETNYCITLDKIGEKYYEEILACDKQKSEWKELFDVDVQNIEDLKEEKYLVIDTKFFDMKFKYKLLSEFDNLDEEIDGVLINSENFGALNLLQDSYKEQVKTVYIDPPYNTGNDGFLYSDGYSHSSWISLMDDRLRLSKNLLSYADSLYFCSIDKNELYNLKMLMDSTLTEFNFINAIVNVNNPKGRSDQKNLPTAHENILFYAKDGAITYGWNPQEKVIRRYNKVDEDGKYRFIDLRKTGDNDRRMDRPNMFYYFYYNESDETLTVSYEELSDENLIKVQPMKNSETDGCWRWELKTALKNIDRLVAKYMPNKQQWSVFEKDYLTNDKKVMPTSVWDEKPFNSERGTETFVNLGFEKEIFKNPKPTGLIEYIFEHSINKTDTILDFFAGSGTTGHSVINLNREDNGRRKYLLVEMGEYFNTVTKPRIQKVIYSDSWKNGKSTTKNGVSQIFKYFKLESYEDTLNNLEFAKTKEQQQTLDMFSDAKEDYLINYSLDNESKASLLNMDAFKTPFDYKLKIATSSVGETKNTTIDLVETFNYLIGIVVRKIRPLENYLIIEGQNLKKENILIVWRNGQSNTELNDFFETMTWDITNNEFDTIYVNGDNNLENSGNKVKLIEVEFQKLMFGK